MQPHRFYDFFAGVGMAELALTPEWKCVWANDIDPKKAATHRANHDPNIFHRGDVAAVDASNLPQNVVMAWASFPCQDLSLAGWRRGMTASRSGTFWAFWRLMSDLHGMGRRPSLIVLENVPGLLYGADFGGLCQALAVLDLQFGALMVDARHFLPQSRARVFVVAVDAQVDVGSLVQPEHGESIWFDKRVKSAFSSLDAPLRDRWRWWRLPEPTTPVPGAETLMLREAPGLLWHSADETTKLLSLMSATNLARIERAMERPGRSVGFLYRRTRAGGQRAEVRFDGLAGCLRTSTGGSSRQIVVEVEDGLVRTRLLAPREGARLMGLPDTFDLPDRYNEAYHAVGDGVAVPVVAWLGRHLLSPLAEQLRLTATDVGPVGGDARVFRHAAESRANVWLANQG